MERRIVIGAPRPRGCSCSRDALKAGKASIWCNYCGFVGYEIYEDEPIEGRQESEHVQECDVCHNLMWVEFSRISEIENRLCLHCNKSRLIDLQDNSVLTETSLDPKLAKAVQRCLALYKPVSNEMKQQYYYSHKSGETYVVQLDNNQVTAIRGPLDYTEIRQDWLGKWDMTVAEAEDLEWYRGHEDDFHLCESYYLPED